MIKKITLLLFCFLWIGLTFYRPANLFQSLGGLFTYSTGVFSLRAPDMQSGTIELKGSGKHEVTIHIDSIGIPHIYGNNSTDVSYGMGYMHGRDRYFQMEIITRLVQGRLAEIMGSNTTASDVFWKPLEIEEKAKEVMEEIKAKHSEVHSQLIAYNDGINFYLNSEKPEHISPEYRMLGFQPRKWETHYPIMLSWYMSYMLTYKDNHTERQHLLNNLPMALVNSLYGADNENYPYIIPETVFTVPTIPDSALFIAPGMLDQKAETIKEKELRQTIGSNNWAVGGKKSLSGNAMLCNDPHLDISLPNPWYEAHVVCSEFNVYGFSIPCSPFIISGFNEYIAWGVTNCEWDLTDRFLLKINPDNKDEYWYEGKWVKIEQREYTISINGDKDTVVNQQYTVFGPVIRGENQVYAQKWYPLAKNLSVASFDKLAKARGWEDFKNALSIYSYPPQNFAYADKQGNTGIISAGNMPLRYAGYSGGLLDGTRLHTESFVPFNSLPQHFNPTQNFVYSANQKPAKTDYYIDYEWHDYYRAERIRQMLAQDKQLTVEDMRAIQADRKDISIEDLKKLIKVYKIKNENWKLLEPLENWDGEITASSREALLQKYFTYYMGIHFYELLKSEYEITEHVPTSNLINFLVKNDTLNIGKQVVLTSRFFDECLMSTKLQLEKDFGNDPEKENYSHFATFDIKHLVRFPGLGSKVTDAGGNANTPNVNTQRVHGASMRTIIVMSEKTEGLAILAGGQSGRPNSRNYKNQLEDWQKVKYHQTQPTAIQGELKNIKNIIHIKANE
jgi:penicillin amidase